MANPYFWYEEDFISFLLSLDLPAYRKNKPLYDVIKEEKELFVSRFKEMLSLNRFRTFSELFYRALDEKLSDVVSSFQSLMRIIEAYDNADMAKAQFEFDEMMVALRPYLFISDIFWPYHPTNFFRVRVSPNEKLKEPKELFHIPYKKRHLVKNERYSLAGHPCLYLASDLYISWQECGYPHNFYYSEFQFQEKPEAEDFWKFITFLSPRKIATKFFVAINPPEENYTKLAQSCIVSYPLLFACSIVNLNGDSAFKPEYVIPQMLTQWVYRHYDDVKGIKYFSCFDADDTRSYNGFNVVMPVKNIDYRRGYSRDLIAKFKATNPALVSVRLGEKESGIVKQYKKDLFNTMRETFFEANDCLFDFYILTDLLDKALRNADNSDMRLVISTVRSIEKSGRRLLADYKKEDIIERGRNGRTYSDRTEKKIEAFSQIYDRFQVEMLEVADAFDTMIDRIPSHKADEFYTI